VGDFGPSISADLNKNTSLPFKTFPVFPVKTPCTRPGKGFVYREDR